MKKTLTISIACLILLAPVIGAQDDPPGPRHEKHWKRLQAFRVWTIINSLDLDTSSEKGAALLEAINRSSNAEKEFFTRYRQLAHDLHLEMKRKEHDEAKITELVLEIERVRREHRENEIREAKEIIRLLTPIERAKLMMAEENFRNNLRDAMRGRAQRGRKSMPNFR